MRNVAIAPDPHVFHNDGRLDRGLAPMKTRPVETRRLSRPLPSSRRRHARRMIVLALLATGCRTAELIPPGPHDTHESYHDNVGLTIEYPDVAECASEPSLAASSTAPPLALEDPSDLPTLELSLEECIRIAVSNSQVIRDAGGSVLSNGAGVQTAFNPALSASNPQLGTEAALSAFDANYTQQLFWANIDQPSNFNPGAFGGGATGGGFALFNPQVRNSVNGNFLAELSKQTATGARFAVRNNTVYNRTNDASRASQLFRSSFTGFLEAEYRQPLMQGSGVLYNQIVGPPPPGNSFVVPGSYGGVLIARINEDQSLINFEQSVIGLVADVETAYWNLALAYRTLAANVAARQSALQTFQYQQIRVEVGTGRDNEAAQARSQYFQFQAQVEQSLAGGSGALAGAGLYAAEQQLRYLIGLPATDGRLIRPSTPPTDVRVVFDWESSVSQAINRRFEIRRQKFNIRQRELELYAARLNKRPRVDLLTLYRWRGLGDNLIGSRNEFVFDNLASSITSGDYQEGQAGVELTFPVGLRRAALAVTNAQLNLRRERAVLAETELRISHDLSNAARQIALSHQLLDTNYNRFQATLREVEVLRRRFREGNDPIINLLNAQLGLQQSETAFYQSLTDYNLALRDFHRQKGSLLAYNNVALFEGPWCADAYCDAHTVGRYVTPRCHPEKVCQPRPITNGPFDPSAVQPSVVPAVIEGEPATP